MWEAVGEMVDAPPIARGRLSRVVRDDSVEAGLEVGLSERSLFRRVGAAELSFIIREGVVFKGVPGCVQGEHGGQQQR